MVGIDHLTHHVDNIWWWWRGWWLLSILIFPGEYVLFFYQTLAAFQRVLCTLRDRWHLIWFLFLFFTVYLILSTSEALLPRRSSHHFYSEHTQNLFRIEALSPKIHSRRRQFVGRLPSEGYTALLLTSLRSYPFGVFICFNICWTSPTMLLIWWQR